MFLVAYGIATHGHLARAPDVQRPLVQDIMYLWALAETYTADADMQQEMR